MIKVAIIGTREPDDIQARLAAYAARALSEQFHCTISTGGAFGIDQIAMENTVGDLIVYLPWPSYNRNIIPTTCTKVIYNSKIHQTWDASVFEHHPAPGHLSPGAFLLHARNYGIIEGAKLVLAFPDERGEGGTGQGIRVARAMKIPVVQVNKFAPGFNEEVLLSAALHYIGKERMAA